MASGVIPWVSKLSISSTDTRMSRTMGSAKDVRPSGDALEELGIGRHVSPLLWPLTPLLPNRIAGVYWVVECLRLDVFV